MKVNPVLQKTSILTPKNTGYSATAAITLTALSGLSKNKSIRKMHKPLSYISMILTAIHIGLIEYYHHRK